MRKKRKRQSILPWLVAIAVLGVALWLLLARVVFVVRGVQVDGAGEIPAGDVMRLSGIRLGAPMRRVDPEQVRLDVESDGRMAFVDLEKRYPNQILLSVRPRSHDAVVQQGGNTLILDAQGYVVEVVDRLPEAQMPYVSGLRASYYRLGRQLDTADGRVAAMAAVLEALKARGAMPYASEVNVEDIEDLRIITRTGVTVLLGNAGNMPDKIAWMAGALADLEARGERGGRLDVVSGTKADYIPETTPEPNGKLYGFDATTPTATPIPEDTPAPES
ncbi:MAG: cell division protein FtsQ/DivIB [Clostridia bacterium]|nr:cell division protein FtsQ/DivIB [Clostridia bacterium]